jgi:hypothetical protein
LCLFLSSGKPPILRRIMNEVCHSESLSITSGDSDMLSIGGRVSWDDSAALLVFASAFELLGSWSSCKKTPTGTIARLEPGLANSFVISFFPHRTCRYSRQSKLFSNLWSSWQYNFILSSKHDHILFARLTMSNECPRTLSQWMPSAVAILRP